MEKEHIFLISKKVFFNFEVITPSLRPPSQMPFKIQFIWLKHGRFQKIRDIWVENNRKQCGENLYNLLIDPDALGDFRFIALNGFFADDAFQNKKLF